MQHNKREKWRQCRNIKADAGGRRARGGAIWCRVSIGHQMGFPTERERESWANSHRWMRFIRNQRMAKEKKTEGWKEINERSQKREQSQYWNGTKSLGVIGGRSLMLFHVLSVCQSSFSTHTIFNPFSLSHPLIYTFIIWKTSLSPSCLHHFLRSFRKWQTKGKKHLLDRSYKACSTSRHFLVYYTLYIPYVYLYTYYFILYKKMYNSASWRWIIFTWTFSHAAKKKWTFFNGRDKDSSSSMVGGSPLFNIYIYISNNERAGAFPCNYWLHFYVLYALGSLRQLSPILYHHQPGRRRAVQPSWWKTPRERRRW